MAILVYTGESFTAAFFSSFSTAIAVFLTWAVGRELDPAHEWSAFVALPVVFIATFILGRPSLLVPFFIILCCRMITRICGLQPKKSDAFLLIVMGIALYINHLYIALPFLLLLFVLDAALKPTNSFQFISALLTSFSYIILLMFFQPRFSALFQNGPSVFCPVFAIILVAASGVFVAFYTRHDRVVDDLNISEISKLRLNLARLATAAWIIAEVFSGGTVNLLQVYPVIAAYGGIFLYHLAGIILNKAHPFSNIKVR